MSDDDRRSVGQTLAAVFSVEGARTLVTGGGSGLGRAMAEIMVDCGADVVVVDVDDERLEKVEKDLSGRPGQIQARHVDVTDYAQIRGTVDEMVAGGGIDVAFANAGGSIPSQRAEGVLDGLDEGWDATLQLNLNGAWATIQAAATPMRRQGSGRIIATCSTAGLRQDPLVSASYIASKGALVNLVRQAALELAPHGVMVNGIAPGPFHTNIGSKYRPANFVPDDTRWNRTIPLGRMGEPEELKGLALLLASKASSFMTGGIYTIDGGAMVNYAR
ncbi:MAG: SDR family oxidoreductase [Acidimicrobiaceae bacterium]|nr:SDR family oxidoreductase [Acidimicrobiaceae bacterium]